MSQLLADRFVMMGAAWIDLATGSPVRILFARAGDRSNQLTWNDRCAELSRLRHPVINTLVDFGLADRDRTFEAYAMNDPLRVRGPVGSLLLTHAVRFLEARHVSLTSALAQVAMRDVVSSGAACKGRPLGVVLQHRSIVAALREALDEASPGGTLLLDVTGPPGSGLRTVRLLTSRAARLGGYIPISSAVVLRLPWIRTVLFERHVCVVVEERHTTHERASLASFLSHLGAQSARRHIVCRFVRAGERPPGALEVESMGVSALSGMVFIDRDCGPSAEEVRIAARLAEGRPGAFLARLRAATFGQHFCRIAMVHESSAAYVYDSRPGPSRPVRRGLGRALLDAAERGTRLASRGRHASAIRLLTRASRVLEARGEAALAAGCSEALAWIDRDRGRTDRAIEGFERTRMLVESGAQSISATIGLGVVWTDRQQFADAEAALRGAHAAAIVLGATDVSNRAMRALARCLHWQGRSEEAAAILTPLVESPPQDGAGVEAWALFARNTIGLGDLRGALAAAIEATGAADRLSEPRLIAVAARAMALVQRALGDALQARGWTERGLRAAAKGHLPLAKLRFRLLSIQLSGSSDGGGSSHLRSTAQLRSAFGRVPLPPLLRAELDAACAVGQQAAASVSDARLEHRALSDLQQLLELVQAAQDDHAALEDLCRDLGERLRAATVQIVSGHPEPRTLARAGRPWQGDMRTIEGVLAGGAAISCEKSPEPHLAAHPIRYGQEPIAVLCCRWTAGVAAESRRASGLLRAGALAAAATVRSVLDRTHPVALEAVGSDLLGTSPAAARLRDAIVRAARAPFPVLVEGESGSGKELVARGIHRFSPRRDRRLCTVNCAALSEDLLEAELFGHSRGAFTGAVGERAGLFEEADGGTLFLDEVGELSPRAQAKLLRVLQDGEVRRVGENLPRRVDAKIIAATNRCLDDEVVAKRFRADLRFRLDVVRIVVPPLRERATDIPALAAHFWTEATGRVGSSATLTAETLASLARYDWPGNVRELQNAIASLAVHAPRRGRVVPSMLPGHIARSSSASPATFEAARHDFERRYVRAALAQSGGHRVRAARALGVSRQGLAKMMRRLAIDE
jgi:DNA-binding NtrC family response regulator/tetratricopeptide (TPR) repeat protein